MRLTTEQVRRLILLSKTEHVITDRPPETSNYRPVIITDRRQLSTEFTQRRHQRRALLNIKHQVDN